MRLPHFETGLRGLVLALLLLFARGGASLPAAQLLHYGQGRSAAAPWRLQLRGGAGWLGGSSDSAADETGVSAALPADDSSSDDSVPSGKYNLSATGLLDPSQYNVTDDVLEMFIRPPMRPTMRDGKALCGVGIMLSNTKPYTIIFIRVGSPADLSAKIFLNDQIVSMDGKNLDSLTFEQILELALGFEDTALTLQIAPSEAQGTRAGGTSACFTIELIRANDYLPYWALPLDGDPGGDGPEAQEWKNKTRAEVREMLVGYPFADFGDWQKMKDKQTHRTFYYDALNKRVQFDKPCMLQYGRKLNRMTNFEWYEAALQRDKDRNALKLRMFGKSDDDLYSDDDSEIVPPQLQHGAAATGEEGGRVQEEEAGSLIDPGVGEEEDSGWGGAGTGGPFEWLDGVLDEIGAKMDKDVSVWQCFALCCRVLQSVALCRRRQDGLRTRMHTAVSLVQRVAACCSVLQCVAVCCSVVQYVAVCCSVLQCAAVCCSVLQCAAVWYSVVQCVAVCCSVLQCGAVCCSVL